MAQVVGNGTLVTFGPECRLVANGALLLENGLIAAVGDTAALRAQHPAARFLDARGQYIMPGMICAHTHTYGAFARGMALKDPPAESFMHILERLWWRLDRAIQPDDIRYSALICLVDAIRHGTTTLFDHHASPNACAGSLDIIAQAFHEAGIRGSLCYEVSDREGKRKAHEGIRENERFIKRVQGAGEPLSSPPAMQGEGAAYTSSPSQGEGRDESGSAVHPPLLAAMMGLHAAFTLSDETIREAVGVARGLGVGCHIHVAEGDTDLRISAQRYGKRTVDRLVNLGVLGPQTITAHCVAIDEHEMHILAETGTLVVHNPRSNMNNAVGTAKVEQMLDKGMHLGLGNDGFSNDMFVEMKAVYLSHKAARGDPRAMPADIVQRLAYANNARIADAGFGDAAAPVRFGELAVGAPADVILVDYHSPTPVTVTNLPWHLIFGIDGGMVTTTIVSGRILMRDRELLTLDEEAICARARALASAVWERF